MRSHCYFCEKGIEPADDFPICMECMESITEPEDV